MDQKYDTLNGWREEVGIKNSKGEVKHYAGGCEWDPTAEAIRAYMEAEKRNQQKEAVMEQLNKDIESLKAKGREMVKKLEAAYEKKDWLNFNLLKDQIKFIKEDIDAALNAKNSEMQK